jgi:hypothetical protein
MYTLNRVEILCDAIGAVKGISDPTSPAYKIRNPLMTKSYAKEGDHVVTSDGVRVFRSWGDGYKSGIFDLRLKLSGKSRASVVVAGVRRKLAAEDTLKELLHAYQVHSFDETAVVSFLRAALEDDSLTVKTPMKFFLEPSNLGQEE